MWHHPDSLIFEGEGGAIASSAFEVLETARLAIAFAVGDTLAASSRVALVGLVGAGDAVDVRDGRFVGDGSNAGKSPLGCWRVETMVIIEEMRSRSQVLQAEGRVR